jgi:hypothetical protein
LIINVVQDIWTLHSFIKIPLWSHSFQFGYNKLLSDDWEKLLIFRSHSHSNIEIFFFLKFCCFLNSDFNKTPKWSKISTERKNWNSSKQKSFDLSEWKRTDTYEYCFFQQYNIFCHLFSFFIPFESNGLISMKNREPLCIWQVLHQISWQVDSSQVYLLLVSFSILNHFFFRSRSHRWWRIYSLVEKE